MIIWRLRNYKELNSGILEELDALVDRKALLEMYKQATAETHSFWFVNLLNEIVRGNIYPAWSSLSVR